MSLIRNETQTALGELHIALKYSADCYRYTAEFLDDQPVSERFLDIAARRERLAGRVAEAIRKTGDLPSEPDPDRETGGQLLRRLRSLFSADQTREVVGQRREGDAQLLDRLDGEEMQVLEREYTELKSDCRSELESTMAELEKR